MGFIISLLDTLLDFTMEVIHMEPMLMEVILMEVILMEVILMEVILVEDIHMDNILMVDILMELYHLATLLLTLAASFTTACPTSSKCYCLLCVTTECQSILFCLHDICNKDQPST